MINKLSSIEITSFCKLAGRNSEIWSEAIGSELTSANGNKNLLDIQKSVSGDVEQVTVGNTKVSETFSINNLQTHFRSITVERRLYLRLFKPEQFTIILEEEKQKKELEKKQRAQVERVRKQEELFIKKLNIHLNQDFLSSEEFYKKHLSPSLSEQSYHNFKASFVKAWIERKEKGVVDRQQANAIASVDRDTIVTARAGSGKTATLVNRIVFLNKHCKVDPTEFLILAFNRNAAAEIRDRLKIATGKEFKNVMTFHSLAFSIERPTEALLYDEPKQEEFNQSSVVQSLVDFHLKDENWNKKIQNVMVSYFKQDWDEIAEKGFNLSPAEMLKFRRNSPKVGLDGWHYKSYGEKKIADVLFEHGITNQYEKSFWWNKTNYKPDFTVQHKDSQIVIEYFGLKGTPDYDELTNEKRAYWTRHPNWAFLEITPNHITRGNFENFLIDLLKQNGVSAEKLSESEIWERIQHRAVDQFSKLSASFINRVRQNSYSPEKLSDLIKSHDVAFPYEEDFLHIMLNIYSGYIQRISDTGEDDFSGLMLRATEKIRRGTHEFHKKNYIGNIKALKFLMIDEFQDFTALFYSCISAIKKLNNRVNIFCVGDDWQAINGFAGSDLKYFKSFTDFFGENSALKIQTNYRSNVKIVNAGNQLMNGQGALAKAYSEAPGNIKLVDLETFEPTDGELHKFENQIFIPAILRLLKRLTTEKKTVTILSRTNSIPWYLGALDRDLDSFFSYLKKLLPERETEKINVSTIHSFKGQQSDAVILIDFKQQRYPFIHPNNFFTRIFGDGVSSILMDERRLLYVALTRAKEELFLISERTNIPSDFKSFSESASFLNWDDYHAVKLNEESSDTKVVTIIGKTFPIRGILKSSGYKWTPRKQKSSGSWSKRINFDEKKFKKYFTEETWVENADDVQILIYSEGGRLEQELKIWSGKIF